MYNNVAPMLSNYLFYKEIKFIARYYKGEYECLTWDPPMLRSLSVASSDQATLHVL